MTLFTFSLRAGRGLTATFPWVLVLRGPPGGAPRPAAAPLAIDPLSEVSASM